MTRSPRTRGAAWTFVALAGCVGAPSVADDVPHFDPRDAIVADRGALLDAGARADAVPSWDAGGGIDAPALDAGAADDAPSECQVLAEAYAQAVHDAATCVGDGDCAAAVCETLCCACQVHVSPGAPSYARLGALRDRWTVLGCATMGRCAGVASCGAATSVACSLEGRCITVHGVVIDASVPSDGADATSAVDARPAGFDGASMP